ncbi:MAG: UvrD-helicase domain-containing protein [Chitinispirillales bacterium]|jgi:exodeoxyribonuclease V beta subunit|nr:UvrD-helicase domain-containing protein [Chitinispirillales bacterium]
MNNNIDLFKHGIIEAHAGTGKTYTIVKMVLRMLELPSDSGIDGKFIHLRDILLVTYTEKAAGELKKRIQDGITERIKNLRDDAKNGVLITHLENCLNNMHEALIGTIHSVCLRILQTWPFETGVHFNTHIINDEEGAKELLRESMRTDWQNEATYLPQALKVIEAYGIKLEGGKLQLICKTALEILRGDKDIDMSRSGNKTIEELVEETENKIREINEEEKKITPLLRNYCELLAKLHMSNKLENKAKIIDELIARFNTMLNTGVYNSAYLSKPKNLGSSKIYTAKERENIPHQLANDIDNAADEICNHSYITVSKDLLELQSKLLIALICRAADALAIRYRIYKRENGFVSYDDMLRLMRDAVESEKSIVLEKLRKRLRYGIIDEFQDTSVIQWKIFYKIFLDAEVSASQAMRMYIVGDPKQSIYSFLNADIQSYIAAKNAIKDLGGNCYGLIENYRSLPEVIDGYNAILRPSQKQGGDDEDWFLYGNSGGISYPSTGCAHPPEKREPKTPQYTLPYKCKAIQIVSLDRDESEDREDNEKVNDDENMRTMADAACIAIKKLKGAAISIPRGLKWENITLDYNDFAVIVEKHDLGNPFIEKFMEHRIPFTKYKLRGIFNSAMARDLLALLTAIHKRNLKAPRTAALLTHFFNRQPETIDPAKSWETCQNHHCSGDDLCPAHALDHWGKLADWQQWAQLFKNIMERTEIQQKLIRLIDGERKIADLRQIVNYSIEYLYQQNSNLKQLIDHLERLYTSEEEAGQDKNIHTLSTEKSSVKILTMHAAKGLEFPVVFLMNKGSIKKLQGPDVLPWIDSDGKRRFTPCLTISKKDESLSEQYKSYEEAQLREYRRLLYVTITRPQAMLFIPMRKKDAELYSHLDKLLNHGEPNINIERFDWKKFNSNEESGLRQEQMEARNLESDKADNSKTQSTPLDDIPELSLQKFITKETSYSQLSRELGAGAQSRADTAIASGHDIDPDDEYHFEDADSIDTNTGTETTGLPASPLLGGKSTGDALHGAIEELLTANDINAIIDNEDALNGITAKYLRRFGILDHPITTNPEEAVKLASSYIKTALTIPYPAANGGDSIIIANLPKSERIPEINFLFAQANEPHRIRGFIDLVFRVQNDAHPAHPYRYYIIDWKSDTLKSYDGGTIEKHCHKLNYTLQSEIYSRALDKYLRGILGERYNREENLGKTFCVFLRGNGMFYSKDIKKII